MSEKNRVVLIGAGGRANAYTMYGAKEQMNLVGVADPHAGNRQTVLGLNGIVGLVPEFDDWRAMFAAVPDIDGVIITTPNHLHVEPAIESMKRGYVVALEKPIAESAESCRRLLDAHRTYNGRILVGFVMRSMSFYQQARTWIDEGRIGEVVTIQADELPHVKTTSTMFRSDWRRYRKTSGGTLLEKCCHDMDMLTWLAGGAPVRLSSMAGVKSLRPNPDRPERCADCTVTDSCPYYLPPEIYNHPDQINKGNDGILYRFVRDNSACIYNNGHDVYDHQHVQMSYDNGVVASLTLDFACVGKTCGRHLKIIGTRGAIYGKLEDNTICLQDRLTDTVERVELSDDGSGHAGSNRIHADAFVRMMTDPAYPSPAPLEAGYLSAMLCFSADASAETQQLVDVSHLMDEAGLDRGFELFL
jgi:predicted dehydrogenase